MNREGNAIRDYYDDHVPNKLRSFIDGNARIDRAWRTIESQATRCPARILEIGCGIGSISWLMSRRWPSSRVIGMDISPRSVETAQRLFGGGNLSFLAGSPIPALLGSQMDLIVLVDVYEHIPVSARPVLYETLGQLRARESRIVLTFPTPRHLKWLRANAPDEIQPVDEDIDARTVVHLAEAIGAEVLLYQEVSVWHAGDYAHAVLGSVESWVPVARESDSGGSVWMRVFQKLLARQKSPMPKAAKRLALVERRLGKSWSHSN